jgi:hypothetical protein
MIKTPVGVAQFCDVPPGRDAPAPSVDGDGALSCCFLGPGLGLRAAGPAQVGASGRLAGGLRFDGPGR